MRLRPCRTGAFLCLLVLAAASPQAGDPHGHVALEVSPVAAPGESGPPRLRLTLRTYSSIRDAELRITTPDGASIEPRLPAGPEPSIPTGDTVRFGDLERGRALSIEFAVALAPRSGGIAGFTLTGTLPDGRPIREAVGWALAPPGPAPVRRFGAIEYPAVPLAEEAR